jgi:hypothetical protein
MSIHDLTDFLEFLGRGRILQAGQFDDKIMACCHCFNDVVYLSAGHFRTNESRSTKSGTSSETSAASFEQSLTECSGPRHDILELLPDFMEIL